MPPLDQLPAAYLAVTAEKTALEQENALLRAQIELLKRKLFGTSQSERVDRDQMLLALAELEKLQAQAAAQPKPAQLVSYERQPAQPRRDPAEAFAKLPVQETIVIEPEEVKAEPEAFEKIGEERTFEVDVVPPRLFKREFVRPKYRRKAEPARAPIVAPAPARPVVGGYASAGLMAWVIVAKYLDHQPLFRQEQQFKRWGAEIPRQTMMEWIRLSAELVEPIYKLMRTKLLERGYIQVDETPIRYHDPTAQKGQTAQGYLWSLSAPGGDVVFQWQITRKHACLNELIGDDYRGLLQADAYEAYPAYAREHEGAIWVACWAHARRKFHEALEESPQRAGFILRLIGGFYADERRWNEAGANGPRLRSALRTAEWTDRLHLLRRVVVRLHELVLPKSGLGLACQYMLNQWDALVAHLKHGQTRIDNNAAENTIRPTKLGMKNWLFIGHPEAGDRSAILYSLVISCKRHGKDPLAYLRDVLTRLPRMTTKDKLDDLLPAKWTAPGCVTATA
jgi:transposase